MKKINWEKKRKSFVIASLRRASLRWPARNEALKLARIERGSYKCASCNDSFGRTEIHLDHIKPIVNLKGFTNWDDYIKGLLEEPQGFQVLCIACHMTKTGLENDMRDYYKKRKKNVDKVKKS